MSLGQQILFFFSALGIFNGFILSFYLLLFRTNPTAASRFLGLLLLTLSVRITKSIFLYFYPGIPSIYIQIGLSGCFLIGPSLFFFTKAGLAPSNTSAKRWAQAYGFWVLLVIAVGLIFPYANYPQPWKTYIPKVIYLQWSIFVLLSGWLLRNLVRKLFTASKLLSVTEKSLLSIFAGALLVNISFVLAAIGFFKVMYISGALFFSLMLYLNIPLFINRKRTNEIFADHPEQDKEKYANKKILDEQAMQMSAKLEQLILERELYKNPDLKVQDLARNINASAHQLSQLLNDNLGKSFATYINEYRINAACALIADDKGIKLEQIGYEVGFNSKSTFYTAFKKIKGTTPTSYKAGLDAVAIV